MSSSYNGEKIFNQICIKLFQYLGIRHIMITAYHPEIDEKGGCYNKTLLTQFQRHVADIYHNWDMFV